MKLFKVITICIVFVFSYSCKQNQSNVSQITSSRVTCHAIEEVTAKYLEKYKSHFTPEEYAERALKALSNVPEEYLEYLFTTNNVQITITPGSFRDPASNNREVCGLAFIDKTSSKPFRTVGNIKSAVECLAHEVGHDMFALLATQHDQPNDNFVTELTTLSRTINRYYRSKASEYLNTYNDSSYWRIDEVLAELFDTWYCSQAARNTLAGKDGIPKAAAFAKKFFLSPVQTDDPIPEYNATEEETAQATVNSNNTTATYQNNRNYTRRVGWFRMGGRRR